MPQVLLLTPPFTQLNTPYPATAYLKGFLNTKGVSSFQADLGIEVGCALFSRQGLADAFDAIPDGDYSDNSRRIISLRAHYLRTIDPVIRFLQGHNPTLAARISGRGWLPEAGRFAQLSDLHHSFGEMGFQDRAKHLATLYLEDLTDLVQECLDEHFGLSRYAERLSRSAPSFDTLYDALQAPPTYTDKLLLPLLERLVTEQEPQLVCLSVPFPGNLYAGLRCAQWIKAHHPQVRIALGGGYPNTELRAVADPRVFELVDFICLDDGEAPLEQLLALLDRSIDVPQLKRTFLCQHGTVTYVNNTGCSDYRQADVGTPDYSDLPLDKYISAIEITNPMHSLWSDGRWNKLTMAHGCYWGKCTFCDISLDYIKNYEPLTASMLCDRMETLLAQTGQSGFHFVDEAAPPALMKALALEILRRGLTVSWWTNVRFEKSFTRDLCLLLKASGCIAVSGGLEVAADRLLQLIKKGITVAQVAQVNRNFTEAGIMVHAYLMYGFPTQTAQETIDSLEMVRQLFEAGILKSAFWHRFAMTAHSPVGQDPSAFGVHRANDFTGTFANNDLDHLDPTGADHDQFGFGLRKSLHNFMLGTCFDFPLHKWFDFKVPKTTVAPDYIRSVLEQPAAFNLNAKLAWLGQPPVRTEQTVSKKGNVYENSILTFATLTGNVSLRLDRPQADWLMALLAQLEQGETVTLREAMQSYDAAGLEDFELFWDNKPMNQLYKAGLLQL